MLRGVVVGAVMGVCAVAACSNDYALVSPDGADAGLEAASTAPEAAAPVEAAVVAPTLEAGSIVDASANVADAGFVYGPPPPGVGCTPARTPTPNECQDFEGTIDTSAYASGEATLSVIAAGNPGKALEVTTQNDDSVSYGTYDEELANLHHLTWSFDLRIDTKLAADTAVSALAIEEVVENPETDCALQIFRTSTGFSVSEFCNAVAGTSTETVLTLPVATPTAATWWSIYADVDLDTQMFRLAVRTDATSAIIDTTGSFGTSKPTAQEEISVGVFRTEGSDPGTIVAIDNLVSYWQ